MAIYLVDTNIFLFGLADSSRLSAAQQTILSEPSNTLLLSAASVLEMTMLHRKGKFNTPGQLAFQPTLQALFEQFRMQVLPIETSHAWNTAMLPVQPGHNDPMDLLILSQALYEALPLLSTDSKFEWYVPHGLKLVA